MQLSIRIVINEKLFLKNPEDSAIGKNIVNEGLRLINDLGFEEFTFKKLAKEIGTTEATVYRYFENKHRLLVYLVNWYWTFLDYKVLFQINNISSPKDRLKKVIESLVFPMDESNNYTFINEQRAFELYMKEGSKAYLTRHVSTDNKDQFFKPYKDLCNRISVIIGDCNPKYKFSHSLSSTLLEMSHTQKYFAMNLPSLADLRKEEMDKDLVKFLQEMLFNTIGV
ncbi:MAG: TetR/AcrR family transcriptional regulator [Flavobacteriales bacterium]